MEGPEDHGRKINLLTENREEDLIITSKEKNDERLVTVMTNIFIFPPPTFLHFSQVLLSEELHHWKNIL